MYVHLTRFPTSAPRAQNAAAATPWGLRHMTASPAVTRGYFRVELDPASQTARFFDSGGGPVEIKAHGSANGDDVDPGTYGDH
ncbi:putative ATP-grasp-modified RiPP [Streptomyces zaomyceticus]|uniref:putative ATP-grasp-modified RiPP n=1 Tax=Streptomyces zaomyceticus TaxID=68286 RepID=UPI0037A14458